MLTRTPTEGRPTFPCKNVYIGISTGQSCTLLLDLADNNGSCIPDKYEMLLAVSWLNTSIMIDGPYGYGLAMIQANPNVTLAAASLTLIPHSSPYAWTALVLLPVCGNTITDPKYKFTVKCLD